MIRTCGKISYYDSNVIIDNTNKPTSKYIGSYVNITWVETCDVHNVALKNSFTVDLLPTTSLYILNDVPIIDINFVIPNAYFNVTVDYSPIQCDFSSQAIEHNIASFGCYNRHQIRIPNYDSICPGFDFDIYSENNEKYALSGQIMVYGDIQVDTSNLFINIIRLTRTAAEPLSLIIITKNY